MSVDLHDKEYRENTKRLSAEEYPSEVSKISTAKPQHPAKITSTVELLLDAATARAQFVESMNATIAALGLPAKAARFKVGPIKRPSRVICKFIPRISKEDMERVLASADPAQEVLIIFGGPKGLRSAKDIVRGMITVVDAAAGLKVHKALAEQRRAKKMDVVWHKDRCQHGQGTPGGWQNELYAIAFPVEKGGGGGYGHICELQLARRRIAIARGELGLHDVFDAVRGVLELLGQLGIKLPQKPTLSAEEIHAELSKRIDQSKKDHLETTRKLNEANANLAGLSERNDAMHAAAVANIAALKELRESSDTMHATTRDADAALEGKDSELGFVQATLDEKDAALEEKDAALKEKDAALDEKDSELGFVQATLEEKDAALEEKDAALEEQGAALKVLQAELERMRAALRAAPSADPNAAAAATASAPTGTVGFGQGGLVGANTSLFSGGTPASNALRRRGQLPSAVGIDGERPWEKGARNILKKTKAGETLANGEVFGGFEEEAFSGFGVAEQAEEPGGTFIEF